MPIGKTRSLNKVKQVDFENFKTKILSRQEAFGSNNLPRQILLITY